MSASALPATALGCPETRPMRPPILANANVVVMLTTMARRTRRKKTTGTTQMVMGTEGKERTGVPLRRRFWVCATFAFRHEQWLRGWNRGRVGQLQQVQLGGSMSELCVELFGYPFLYTLLYPRHSLASRVAAVSKTFFTIDSCHVNWNHGHVVIPAEMDGRPALTGVAVSAVWRATPPSQRYSRQRGFKPRKSSKLVAARISILESPCPSTSKAPSWF
ncbi:hypothetical protein KC347_g83 [Hortaea werneckii]|nr:hypothetical protein KC347_g83 [Hortaea werneckii]